MTWKLITAVNTIMGPAVPLSEGTKPNKTSPAGRVCADPSCSTQLSIYNPNDVCSTHGGSKIEVPLSEVLPGGTRGNRFKKIKTGE